MTFGLALYQFEDAFALKLLCWFVTLPWRPRTNPEPPCESWGVSVYLDTRTVHFTWGRRYWILFLPWMMSHCRTEVMLADGTFVPEGEVGRSSVPRYVLRTIYSYRLESGDLQIRAATVRVERRSLCWHGIPFRWLRWPSAVKTAIWVEFADEVGERTGSWKGGVMACGWGMLAGESPEACLRRMERERKFE